MSDWKTKTYSSKRTGEGLITLGGSRPHPTPPEITEWIDREFQSPPPLRYPPLPRLDPDQPLPSLAAGWRLAWHKHTGAKKGVTHNGWKPPMRKALLGQVQRWGTDPPSPAAIAAIRFRDVMAWTHRPPKGPTAVYARVNEYVLRDARTLQQQCETRLVQGAEAAEALRRARHGLHQIVRKERATSPADLRCILDRLGLGKAHVRQDMREAAAAELRASSTTLSKQAQRTWIW